MRGRLLLLQDVVYLPSYGGGNKANRLLLTELAARGFECHVAAGIPGERRVLARHFSEESLAARGVAIAAGRAGGISYRYQGVNVETLNFLDPAAAARIAERIGEVDPDWLLVSDDRHGMLLDIALRHAPQKVMALVHTHFHLPFGPEADKIDAAQHARLRAVRGIAAVSEYSRIYLRDHGELDSTLLRFPVFGTGPFVSPVRPQAGHVLMINPCLVKGLPIFLELAACFPDVSFAAVPTWGANEAELRALSDLPNVTLFEPADDVGTVLRDARLLLAPSLVPETFGYVIVDAMLRGIPVLAGNLGAQPEAKLGVDFVLPVAPALRNGVSYTAPPQDIAPWRAALDLLLSDGEAYRRCASASRDAALRFLPQTDAGHFVRYLESLGNASVSIPGHATRAPAHYPAAPR
jgi:glycosyltransferase involved in cell wall biosynthesis